MSRDGASGAGLPWPLLGLALLTAAGAFAATFRGPRAAFWPRMTRTGCALGAAALALSPASRAARIRSRDVALGLASAAALDVTFELGDRVVRRLLLGGAAQVARIYALRELRPHPELAARLVAIIGPAEELFWRGLVQAELMRRLGRWRGTVVATGAYALVHVPSGNLTLVGAAAVGGAHWGGLYAAGVPLGALIVSHVAWDAWIFLVRPTPGGRGPGLERLPAGDPERSRNPFADRRV